LFSCEHDEIERDDLCSFTTGDQFAIIRGDGYRTIVNWGYVRFPGSEMIARLDDDAPVSTKAETWTPGQSRWLYMRMMRAQTMRYRFVEWPSGASRDGSINLASFADTSALMEAIRDQFIIAQLTGKARRAK
jgi:hypothetical protein